MVIGGRYASCIYGRNGGTVAGMLVVYGRTESCWYCDMNVCILLERMVGRLLTVRRNVVDIVEGMLLTWWWECC
jgi:hypothetical protein